MFFTASMLSTEASVSFTEPKNSNKPNLALFKSPNVHVFNTMYLQEYFRIINVSIQKMYTYHYPDLDPNLIFKIR